MSGPGFILGAPSASHCAGACGTRFSEDLTPEETQTSWDKDIPAINQGEDTVFSWSEGYEVVHVACENQAEHSDE